MFHPADDGVVRFVVVWFMRNSDAFMPTQLSLPRYMRYMISPYVRVQL